MYDPATELSTPWAWTGWWLRAAADGEAPDADPTLLSATFVSVNRIDLDWTDNATNESGYKIERDDGGGFVEIAVIATPDLNTYSDTTVAEDMSYDYRVRAYRGSKNSGYSNTATQETLPSAPSGLVADMA